jgi:hypothetical protein
MGTLYSLLSPGQADMYYGKSLALASGEDSIHTVMSRHMMAIKPRGDNETVFGKIRKIDLKLCSPIQIAALDYLYSVMAQADRNLDMALFYIQRAEFFYSTLPGEGYFNSMIQHQTALVHFDRGELTRARQAIARSDSICRRDSIRLTATANLDLMHQILLAEGRELESLMTFKKHKDKLDSLLGYNQIKTLTGRLMQIMLNEDEPIKLPEHPQKHHRLHILLIVTLILGIAILYYYRDLFNKDRGQYQLLSHLSEQGCNIGSSPELKQHLSVLMFEYGRGLDHYVQQLRNSGGTPEDYHNLGLKMKETNDFIDRIKKWMDEQPCAPVEPSRFEARKAIELQVRMIEIVFYSKQMTIFNHIKDEIFVFGNHVYFNITVEIMLFRLMQDSRQHSAIHLSAGENADFVTFSLASPSYVMSDEIQTMIRVLLQKLQTNPKAAISLQTRAEICLKCVYENNGKMWFESSLAKGTVLNFTIPKNDCS